MTTESLTRAQARKIAHQLIAQGFYGLEIVEEVPEGRIRVRGHNRVGMPRSVATLAEAEELLATEGRRSARNS